MDLRTSSRAQDTLTEQLRRRIVGGVHRGQLHAGDRLPSSRQLGDELGVDHRFVAKAYRELAAQGLVELRPRSGVYLSAGEPRCGGDSKLGHSALWIRDVATEAWLRRIPLAELPPLIDRFLSARTLHAICVESARDPLEAIQYELERDFGLDVSAVSATDPEAAGDRALDWIDALHSSAAEADLVVSTAFHMGEVQKAIEGVPGAPLLVQFTLNLEWRLALRRAMAEDGLLVVGIDPATEERFRIGLEIDSEDDFRFATLEEWRKNPDRPGVNVHATHAARERDSELASVALASLPPVLSMETARSLSAAIVIRQVNP